MNIEQMLRLYEEDKISKSDFLEYLRSEMRIREIQFQLYYSTYFEMRKKAVDVINKWFNHEDIKEDINQLYETIELSPFEVGRVVGRSHS